MLESAWTFGRLRAWVYGQVLHWSLRLLCFFSPMFGSADGDKSGMEGESSTALFGINYVAVILRCSHTGFLKVTLIS